MLHQLSLDSLGNLDMGKVIEAFSAHINRTAKDCMDRPGDSKPRTVTLQLSLVPVLQPEGDCNEVRGQFHVKSTIPTHRTKVYSFGLRHNGVLVFSEDSPDAIDQTTMDFGREE